MGKEKGSGKAGFVGWSLPHQLKLSNSLVVMCAAGSDLNLAAAGVRHRHHRQHHRGKAGGDCKNQAAGLELRGWERELLSHQCSRGPERLGMEDITRAMKIVHGTAVASGIKVEGYEEWLETAVAVLQAVR